MKFPFLSVLLILWVATPGGVTVLSQDGKRLALLSLPGKCTSVDFSDAGHHHLVAVTTRAAPHITRLRFSGTR